MNAWSNEPGLWSTDEEVLDWMVEQGDTPLLISAGFRERVYRMYTGHRTRFNLAATIIPRTLAANIRKRMVNRVIRKLES
jgi:phosphoserine phosphatase